MSAATIPFNKRRFRPVASDSRVFTRQTSSEMAGERYGIEDDMTWKVFGIGAKVRQSESLLCYDCVESVSNMASVNLGTLSKQTNHLVDDSER